MFMPSSEMYRIVQFPIYYFLLHRLLEPTPFFLHLHLSLSPIIYHGLLIQGWCWVHYNPSRFNHFHSFHYDTMCGLVVERPRFYFQIIFVLRGSHCAVFTLCCSWKGEQRETATYLPPDFVLVLGHIPLGQRLPVTKIWHRGPWTEQWVKQVSRSVCACFICGWLFYGCS